MEEIAQTFADAGLTPKFHQGAADLYRFVASTTLAEETPERRDRERTLRQVVASRLPFAATRLYQAAA
jgi:hypothetical protein